MLGGEPWTTATSDHGGSPAWLSVACETVHAVARNMARSTSVLGRHHDFRVLWAGESVSMLGSEISVVALPSLAVLVFGAGAAGIGLLMALQWIPFVVLAPVLGAVTDRWPRRPLMQAANLARAALLGSLPVAAALGVLSVHQLYAIAVGKGVCDVVFQVAYQAYLPEVLGGADLVDGNAATQLSRSSAVVAGRAAGGGLVSWIGPAFTVTADAISYLVAAATLRLIHASEPIPPPEEHGLRAILTQVGDGVSMTVRNQLLRYLILMSTCGNAAGSAAFAVTVTYAYQSLHFSAADLGLALGAGSLTLLVGAVTSRAIYLRWGAGRTLLLTQSLLGVAFLVLPLASVGGTAWALTIVTVSQGVSGFTLPLTNLAVMTLIPKIASGALLGRVVGSALPLVWGANALGPLLGGAVAATAGPIPAFLVTGLLAGAAIAWIYVGGIHQIRHHVPDQLQLLHPPGPQQPDPPPKTTGRG